jgi:hypothetical protein
LYVGDQKAVIRTANNYSKEHDMNDYDDNMDDEWSDEQLLGTLGEELSDETVDEDCEIWGFSLLEEEAEEAA